MPGRLLLVCVLVESFKKFPVDPYYEPLSWFMILLRTIYSICIYREGAAVTVTCGIYSMCQAEVAPIRFISFQKAPVQNIL